MAKSDRLFRLLNGLRGRRGPVTADQLARENEISVRTVYRDIETLRSAGALIDGAPGYGFSLTEDPSLPPQNLTRLEIEALAMGLREVMQSGDQELAEAADKAMTKIVARLPDRQQRQAMHLAQHIWRRTARDVPQSTVSLIRQACWDEVAVRMIYEDVEGNRTERIVLPLLLEFQDQVLLLHAWCNLRSAFRQFRIERIVQIDITDESFRPRRVPLLRQYIVDVFNYPSETNWP